MPLESGTTAELMRRWIEKKRRVESIREARAEYTAHVKKVMHAFNANLREAERELAGLSFSMPAEPTGRQ